MKILVTGAAGFIGYHLCKKLIELDLEVIGIDNINTYYDVQLKYSRLEQLGIEQFSAEKFSKISKSKKFLNFSFYRIHLQDQKNLQEVFEKEKFDLVVNLAAQAGVRYSLENPGAYVQSNLVGFANILECCRNFKIKHLVYASSSSVYGQNTKVPFSVNDNVDHPISLYAATKKSNELMAHTYSHLYGFKTTGLRFFTVYGPWGRPDMALFLFTKAIINKEPIKVFNHGELERDFTYISDIIEGITKIIQDRSSGEKEKLYSLHNIGNSKPVKLLDFIEEIENQLSIKAEKKMMPMQPGDVSRTWADVSPLQQKYQYNPKVSLKDGVANFIAWYKEYYNI